MPKHADCPRYKDFYFCYQCQFLLSLKECPKARQTLETLNSKVVPLLEEIKQTKWALFRIDELLDALVEEEARPECQIPLEQNRIGMAINGQLAKQGGCKP